MGCWRVGWCEFEDLNITATWVARQGNRTKNISSHHGFRRHWIKRNVGRVLPYARVLGCVPQKNSPSEYSKVSINSKNSISGFPETMLNIKIAFLDFQKYLITAKTAFRDFSKCLIMAKFFEVLLQLFCRAHGCCVCPAGGLCSVRKTRMGCRALPYCRPYRT
jgi:hypothetical protein